MNAKKIVLMLPHLRAGGAETVMVRIANGLARRGHSIILLVLSGTGPLGSEVDSKVAIIDLQQKRTRYALPAMVRCLRNLRPSAVLSTLGRLNLLLALARPFLGNMRIIAREASIPSSDLEGGGHALMTRLLYPLLYPRIDTIVCQSDAMLDDVHATLNIPRDRLVRIYNPAPRAEIEKALAGAVSPFAIEEKAVVVCGRLSREKGLDTVIDAFTTVRARDPAAVLYVLGEGELRELLKAQALKLGLGDGVVFCGHRRDRYRYFHFADVVVSASRWEGLPNVILESIACGTPVIATDCPGGTKEIVSVARNGWLVPPGDPDALGHAIVEYLSRNRRIEIDDIRESIPDFEENAVLDLIFPPKR